MPSVTEILGEHDKYVDNLLGGFEKELSGVASAAQAKLAGELAKRLALTGGVIDRTAANRAVLRRIDQLFAAAMDAAGYQQLVQEFVAGFGGQLPFFGQMLDAISGELQTPLAVQWTKPDLAAFEAHQMAAVDVLGSVIDGAAATAKRKALMNVNALPFGDLVDEIHSAFGRAVPESVGLAETASAMFFRTATDRGFRQIEQSLPAGSIRYQFEGPKDKLTRPWCKTILARTKTAPMTREAIEALDNGQLPNPFLSGGGYRCRHQWVIAALAVPGKVVVGKHIGKVESDLGKEATAELLSALDGSPVLPWLERNPVARVRIDRNVIEGRDNVGAYTASDQSIDLDSARKHGTHFGYPEDRPGLIPSWSMTAATKIESLRRSLIHEAGHHVMEAGPSEIRAMALGARAKGAPITIRADINYREYFAETWTAYHLFPDMLRTHDPAGYEMIEGVWSLLR